MQQEQQSQDRADQAYALPFWPLFISGMSVAMAFFGVTWRIAYLNHFVPWEEGREVILQLPFEIGVPLMPTFFRPVGIGFLLTLLMNVLLYRRFPAFARGMATVLIPAGLFMLFLYRIFMSRHLP